MNYSSDTPEQKNVNTKESLDCVSDLTKGVLQSFRDFEKCIEDLGSTLGIKFDTAGVVSSALRNLYSNDYWIQYRIGSIALSRIWVDDLSMVVFYPDWKRVFWRIWKLC